MEISYFFTTFVEEIYDMDQIEKERILSASQLFKNRESAPDSWTDPYYDMTPEEKSKLIIELMQRQEVSKKEQEASKKELEAERQQRAVDRERIDGLLKKLDMMLEYQSQNAVLVKQVSQLLAQNANLEAELKLRNKHTYSSKSQKVKKDKDTESPKSREEEKGDFDGTPGSIDSNSEVNEKDENKSDSKADATQKEIREYRKGLIYETMKASSKLIHKSDLTKLPAGSIILKQHCISAYEQVSQIIEHQYQFIKYKTPDGKFHDEYIPCDDEPGIVDIFPGTHASASFMAYLAFNKYVLDTPLYREISRMMNEKMRVSRMTLTNWLEKGSDHIKKIIDILKEQCMEKDSIINCDETWCRVKVRDKYKKRYIWCLVNKASKVVIYCYEKGSRSRDALKHILGDREIKALQSDGYNVYMYLDNHMIDVDHLCCMAHARAKFVYAFEQGDPDAEFFLDCMRELYILEAEYEKKRLSPDEIKIQRGSLKTQEIIIKMRSKLDAMKSESHPPRGDLMEKALRYLDTFWDQLFVYLKDGSYTIDNSIAERYIRPLSGERKNSLFFGSDKMAEVSACYHSILSTCKMMGVSSLEYLKKFFKSIVNGSRDYGNLLPATIGINQNKI